MRHPKPGEAERDRQRERTQPWRAWYRTARWKRLRWAVLVRDLFTCRKCGHLEHDASRLICDHVERHHGDEIKFWAGPFQTLCTNCHSGAKQSEEIHGYSREIGEDGWPTDERHPANQGG